jgi:TetR/AcrR family transcriptional regulator, fatty acid metabolism regulator protein
VAQGKRKSEILEVARDMFARRGFDRTTMADIAEVVGVVESALYRHYSSKQELLVAAIRTFYEPIIVEVEEAARSIVDPLARVRFAVWRHLRAFAEDPEVCRLVAHEARGLPEYWGSEVAELNRRYTSFVVHAVNDGIERGVFCAGVSPTMVRDVVYGTVEHIGWATMGRSGDVHVDELTDQLMALLEPGLTRSASATEQLQSEVDRLAKLVAKVAKVVNSRSSADVTAR